MKVEVTSRAADQSLENLLEPGHPVLFTGSPDGGAGIRIEHPSSQG